MRAIVCCPEWGHRTFIVYLNEISFQVIFHVAAEDVTGICHYVSHNFSFIARTNLYVASRLLLFSTQSLQQCEF